MKEPVWLRVAGGLVFVSLLGVIADAQLGEPGLLYTINLFLCCASLLIWLDGTVRWHAQRRQLKAPARPPVEQPPPARPLGARLSRLTRDGLLVLLLLFILFVWLPVYKVQRIENRVTQGMTVAELMRVVDGWWMMQVFLIYPEYDADLVPVTRGASGYTWRAAGGREEHLSLEELSDRLQRFGDHTLGVPISFTYLTGPGSARYSFGVKVGRDGKVLRSVHAHRRSWDWWIHHLREI